MKLTTITHASPLPLGITPQVVIDFMHGHEEIIDLSPLVVERHPIPAPAHASPEEQHYTWWSVTERITYLPGDVASAEYTHTAGFLNLPNGMICHSIAPLGTEIKDHWTLQGVDPASSVLTPGPTQRLSIRVDSELQCNLLLVPIVKRNLRKSHEALVNRLAMKAQNAAASGLHASMRNHYTESRILVGRHSTIRDNDGEKWDISPQTPIFGPNGELGYNSHHYWLPNQNASELSDKDVAREQREHHGARENRTSW